MPRQSKLLNPKVAQEASKRLATMEIIEPEITMRQFIEANLDKLQELKGQGRTKQGVYNFLTKICNLDLGSYQSFSYLWNQCVKKRKPQQDTPGQKGSFSGVVTETVDKDAAQ